MKALYIRGNTTTHPSVRLDGPALKLIQEHSAPTRYPLSRVSRVVITGRVQLHTDALLACLQRQIPVAFADDMGTLIGICQGSRSSVSDGSRVIDAFLARDDWHWHYQNWYKSQTQRQIIAALRRAPYVQPRDLRPRSVADAFASLARTLTTQKEYDALHLFHLSCVQALVAEVAQALQLDPALLMWRRAGLNLIADLAQILQWRLHPTQIEYLANRATQHDARAVNGEKIGIFETESEALWAEARQLFDQIDYWMRGIE